MENRNCFYYLKKLNNKDRPVSNPEDSQLDMLCQEQEWEKMPRGKRVVTEIMIMVLAKHLFSVQICDEWATDFGAWWAYTVYFFPVGFLLLIILFFLSFHHFYSLWSHNFCECCQGGVCWVALPWKWAGAWGWGIGWNFLACSEFDLFSVNNLHKKLSRYLRRLAFKVTQVDLSMA